jgi:hypothetical protein
MAAVEGNLMLSDTWHNSGEMGEANLAEYHLDWWNGFNKKYNADIAPRTGGLTVHQGGDYLVAAAYMSRGDGAVRNIDGQSYNTPPAQHSEHYKYFYARDIEWHTAGASLENISAIKESIMNNGVMGTALAWSQSMYNSSTNSFYQPTSSSALPNHAVAIVGWDDNKVTKANRPGAWLIKNSWGTSWGQGGYFWISYYDKVAGRHPQMGAVSFKNVERLRYDKIYYHDYHGWRDTKANATAAFNAYKSTANSPETLTGTSFYTAKDNVDYEVHVYANFENGQLSNLLTSATGNHSKTGFHTIDFDQPVVLQPGQKFYIMVRLSHGGHAFDKTSDVPVLLGSQEKVTVESFASPGQSYYLSNNRWVDLTSENSSANFCIKGLVEN